MKREDMTEEYYQQFLQKVSERLSMVCKNYIESHPEQAQHILAEIERCGGKVVYLD